jgi:hypothetical protein
MKVNVLFIHPVSGMHDVTVEEAPSVEHVRKRLEEEKCQILNIEEALTQNTQ